MTTRPPRSPDRPAPRIPRTPPPAHLTAAPAPSSHYPELLGSATCINAPPLYTKLWTWVSPLLSRTLQKRVTTVDADGSREAITRLATLGSVPKAYGGTCVVMPPDVHAALGTDRLSEEERRLMLPGAPCKLAGYGGDPPAHDHMTPSPTRALPPTPVARRTR